MVTLKQKAALRMVRADLCQRAPESLGDVPPSPLPVEIVVPSHRGGCDGFGVLHGALLLSAGRYIPWTLVQTPSVGDHQHWGENSTGDAGCDPLSMGHGDPPRTTEWGVRAIRRHSTPLLGSSASAHELYPLTSRQVERTTTNATNLRTSTGVVA